MKQGFYGIAEQTQLADDSARCVEEISIRGYTVIPDLLSHAALVELRNKIDAVYEIQERTFGKEALAAIGELDACRAPLLYDFDFIDVAQHPIALQIVRRFLGDWFILNLQNSVINRAGKNHHQSAWHRDLPYQNFVISTPIALNVLWAVDAFSEDSGGTYVLPFSHKLTALPSDAYIRSNQVVLVAPAGSAILFDSMLIHRAGANRSASARRAINHLYTTPIIKQQYDFPRALSHMQDVIDPQLQRLLGFTSQVPIDDKAWRFARSTRLTGAAQ
ncbi:MAG: phytanoyl-CoA dioxygenase family protein [Burkholderiaceae bacterium]